MIVWYFICLACWAGYACQGVIVVLDEGRKEGKKEGRNEMDRLIGK